MHKYLNLCKKRFYSLFSIILEVHWYHWYCHLPIFHPSIDNLDPWFSRLTLLLAFWRDFTYKTNKGGKNYPLHSKNNFFKPRGIQKKYFKQFEKKILFKSKNSLRILVHLNFHITNLYHFMEQVWKSTFCQQFVFSHNQFITHPYFKDYH